MKCIFCKKNSENSKSVEHIIPESLGNKDHILDKGIVCDACNNYFALKIEKIVLDIPYFKSVRHRNLIESKKGIIPNERAFMGADPNVFIDNNFPEKSIVINNPLTVSKILNNQIFHMIVPHFTEPPNNDKELSRFLGKIAIEVLASSGRRFSEAFLRPKTS
jgi:HNH endonuclease